MKFKYIRIELFKLLVATVAAVAVTTTVGIFQGIPRDIDSLERKIQAFEQASYENGRPVSDERRDKTLADAGLHFDLQSSSTSTSQVQGHSFSKLLETAVRWYPTVFCLTLLVVLFLLRGGYLAGTLLTLAIAPLATLASASLAGSIAASGCLYLIAVFLRRAALSKSGAGKA